MLANKNFITFCPIWKTKVFTNLIKRASNDDSFKSIQYDIFKRYWTEEIKNIIIKKTQLRNKTKGGERKMQMRKHKK